MEDLLNRLRNLEKLSCYEIENICLKAQDVFITEPNIAHVKSPVVVCGDLHGQYKDFLRIMDNCPSVHNTSYIFLGDYVDRGIYSLEIILSLLIYKILYPKKIFLIRGNHEYKPVNRTYGFKDEISYKYSHLVPWHTLNRLFKHFSVGCIIDNRYLCLHGGISHRMSVARISRANRFKDDAECVISDAVWSDPSQTNEMETSPRGCGFLFDQDTLKYFLMMNNLEALIRSHQLAAEGYRIDHDGLCYTVWSAPDYMGKCLNHASVIYLEKNETLSRRAFIIFSTLYMPTMEAYLAQKRKDELEN